MEFATQCLHAGYEPKNGEPGALPIIQSTTFKYDKTADVAALFDLKAAGFFYSPDFDCEMLVKCDIYQV